MDEMAAMLKLQLIHLKGKIEEDAPFYPSALHLGRMHTAVIQLLVVTTERRARR
jgi:hypothetical protein